MSDKIKEIVQPAAEATIPSVHPDVSAHVETAGDMEHLKRIHSELSDQGVKVTGELTQVSTEPQTLNPSQFEVAQNNVRAVPQVQETGEFDDSSSWKSIYGRRQSERKELKHAA